MNDILIKITIDETTTLPNVLRHIRELKGVLTATRVTEKQVVSAGMHRPVCNSCSCEMIPFVNGVGVLDHADFGPYSLWDADLWQCPKCGKEVIGGFGQGPISAHYEMGFQRMIEHYDKVGKLVHNHG